jgi:hypothetical protein
MTTTPAVKQLALDHIRIGTPCKMPWSDMVGDAQVRFCGKCSKNVYNLSAMTHHDAQALLDASEGQACVRLFRRADGTVVTQDCKPAATALPRSWARVGARFAAAFGLAAGAALLPQPSRADETQVEVTVDGGTAPEPAWIMGDVVEEPQPQPPAPPESEPQDR